jgi:hypothetical protein
LIVRASCENISKEETLTASDIMAHSKGNEQCLIIYDTRIIIQFSPSLRNNFPLFISLIWGRGSLLAAASSSSTKQTFYNKSPQLTNEANCYGYKPQNQMLFFWGGGYAFKILKFGIMYHHWYYTISSIIIIEKIVNLQTKINPFRNCHAFRIVTTELAIWRGRSSCDPCSSSQWSL